MDRAQGLRQALCMLPRFRTRGTDRIALLWHLLLGLFLLRSLIPVGFMPDYSAKGGIALAFCTSSGLQESADLAVESGHDLAGHAKHQHKGECAFAVSSAAPLASSAPVASGSFEPVSIAILASSLHHLPGSPRGPPLGSRAPPSFLS